VSGVAVNAHFAAPRRGRKSPDSVQNRYSSLTFLVLFLKWKGVCFNGLTFSDLVAAFSATVNFFPSASVFFFFFFGEGAFCASFRYFSAHLVMNAGKSS
jgi:hypothetical protein